MKAVYCVGTHWDREWYEPFQEFRMWLVELIDELMDLMEKDPGYKSFHLDGQTIMVADYLAIRPEQKERLLRLIRARRLLIGPWYNLPDEWLVSGESFIRNLMRGFKDCRELGVEPLNFAYTPDQFGHIAALPMIMSGFGLQAGIVWRGAQDENYPAQFVWVGPDGSRMPYYKLMDKGSYGPFDFLARTPIKKAGYSDESFKEYFEPYFKEESERGAAPLVLMLDAIDHQRPDPEMPGLLRQLQQRYPDVDFEWASLEMFGKELVNYADCYPERTGELREPVRDGKRGGQYLIVHTISSRVDLKRKNDLCAALLEKWCEPGALFALMQGHAPVLAYLDKAWEYLLKNHPHDSICGCSIDQVHRDMHYRFDQARMLGEGLVRRCIAPLGNATSDPENWQHIAVHNPLPEECTGVFDIALYFPADYAAKTGHTYHDGLATGEQCNKFHLVDTSGKRLAYQHCRIERGIECRRLNALGRNTMTVGDVYHVAVEMTLPACGVSGFSIEGTDDGTRTFGSLLTGPMAASNGMISISISSDGALKLVDRDGRTFNDLLLYDDAGDCGDGWTRGIPINDTVIRSHGSVVSTGIEENGPLRVTFRVERQLAVPRRLDPKTRARSRDRVLLEITDLITLEKHCNAVKVKTIINNNGEDHRLRVLFPTHCKSDVSFADTPFAVVERGITIPESTALWHERVNEEKAFTSFFGVADHTGGLAVVSAAGPHEYAVLQSPARELALTLFRAFRKTVGKPEEKDGQLPGELVFNYALVPFSGEPPVTTLLQLAARLQTPVRFHASGGSLSARSFLTLKHGDAVVTAIKPAADGKGGIIRFWNPTRAAIEDGFKAIVPVTSAWYCDLNETQQKAIALQGEFVPVTIPAGGISTVRFTWQ